MLKISYTSDWNKETGTHYTQRVKATGKEMDKIAHFLNKDYEYIQNIKKTKNVYTSNEMHKIAYQKHLAETPQEIMSSGATKFYLNLTQLDTILHNILGMVFESKRYNSIITDDMVLYVFGKKEQDIKDFIDWAMGQIRDDDECWGTWIYCNEKSVKLNSFIDKEEL